MYEHTYYYEPLTHTSIHKAAYDVLVHHKQNGLWPLLFRWNLGTKLREDEDKVLQGYELKLIREGWLIQTRAGELIRPSDKLIRRFLKV